MSKHKQKFQRGDLVKVADDLGAGMDHFEKGCYAVVLYSYADEYGAHDDVDSKTYALELHKHGYSAWYDEKHLTLVSKGYYKSIEKQIERMFDKIKEGINMNENKRNRKIKKFEELHEAIHNLQQSLEELNDDIQRVCGESLCDCGLGYVYCRVPCPAVI